MTADKERYRRAADHFAAGRGPFDLDAEHALDCFWPLYQALDKARALSALDDPEVNDALAMCEVDYGGRPDGPA